MVQIFKIDTSRRSDARDFVQFQFDLYRDSPYWVPPLFSDAYRQIDRRRNPYFQHSDADFFLARQGKEVVGRIAVLENRNYINYHKKPDGFFYLFETINDQGVVNALYDAAFEWCRQRGLKRIIGPKGFTVFEGYGMLREGFEYLPAMGVPYNHPYYCPLTEAVGFEKEIDFTSFRIKVTEFQLPERIARLAEKVQERRGLKVRNFTSKAEIRAAVPEIVKTYNEVFVENWEYVPVTEAEAEMVARQMLQITRPEMVKVIIHNGKIVGFLLAFLNIGKAMQKARGRLFPLGWYYILRELKRTRLVDVNGMGILEEYRGLGGNVIMYNELYKSIGHGLFDEGEMVQMADWVVRMLSDAHTLGGKPCKVHRVYRRDL